MGRRRTKSQPIRASGKTNSREAGAVSRRYHLGVAAVAALLIALAYSNALHGKFVYDDNLEIVANPYIQRSELFWTAMTSDVWAFKGKRDEPWSNYWRPAFVAWMAMNYQLFGLNVVGWHVTSLLAHLAVTLLVFHVLLKLEARPWVAAVVCWGFAVHPVHVESVAWASGIPDILMSACLLASFLFYLSARRGRGWGRWMAAGACYALALLCKEGAVMFPLIIVGTEWIFGRREGLARGPAAVGSIRRTACFFALALAFVAARYAVLGRMRQLAPGAPELAGVITSAPLIMAFYLRQIVWPMSLGPVHAIRAVTGAQLGFSNFILPLAILIALGIAGWRLGRRRPALALGLLWFICPLALAFDIRVFLPEQLVHDRYLYLPLFGALWMLAEVLAAGVQRVSHRSPQRVPIGVVSIGLALACVWAVLTWRYTPVWSSDVAMWERGIAIDPSSGTAFTELGNAYWKAGRGADAKRVYAEAMRLNPNVTNTHLGLGVIANAERRFADAEQYFRIVLERFPDQETALEQLALTYQELGRLDEAIVLFDEGRKRLPDKHGVYTKNIAVLHVRAGRTREGLAELESIRDKARNDPQLVDVWSQLGDLYRLHGRIDQAVEAYQEYVAQTVDRREPAIQRTRSNVARIAEQLASKSPGTGG